MSVKSSLSCYKKKSGLKFNQQQIVPFCPEEDCCGAAGPRRGEERVVFTLEDVHEGTTRGCNVSLHQPDMHDHAARRKFPLEG